MEKRKKQTGAILTAAIIILVILLILVIRIVNKYTPSKEQQDMMEYYGLTEENKAALVLNNELIDKQAVVKDGVLYLDYETVHDLLNSRFYWDANENLLLYTTPSDLVSAEAGSSDYFITKEKKSESYTIVYADAQTAYIAIDYVKKYTDMDYSFFETPNRVTIQTDWSEKTAFSAKKDTELRYKGGIKSPILKDIKKGDKLILLEKGEDWDKTVTEDGIIGYVKSKRLGKEETVTYEHEFEEESFSHILKDKKINMGWHQVTVPEANDKVNEIVSNTKGLNVISPTWFYLNDNEGNLKSFASAEYVSYCHEKGIEVWALVSNLENKDVDSTEILTHTSKRTKVVNQLIAAAIQYNFDGINVDFEALSTEVGDGYIQFIRELSLKCANNGLVLSVDNYVPSSYTAFYNRAEQAKFADYVVVMGYDEHYAGSDEGSVASIGFVKQGIEDTLKEVPAEQTILAAPLYTRVWAEKPKEPSEDVEAAADDYVPYDLSSQAVGMKEAWNMVSVNGATPEWNDECGQYYAEYVNGEIVYKVWLEDVKSIELKLQTASEFGIAGASFWKLGFEESTLWDTIIKYMN